MLTRLADITLLILAWMVTGISVYLAITGMAANNCDGYCEYYPPILLISTIIIIFAYTKYWIKRWKNTGRNE